MQGLRKTIFNNQKRVRPEVQTTYDPTPIALRTRKNKLDPKPKVLGNVKLR